LQSFFPAIVDTLAAANTLVGAGNDSNSKINTFRIMTPVTTQGTAFEKNGCPDVGAIMECISFYSKYC
jgi:hypothetical protein